MSYIPVFQNEITNTVKRIDKMLDLKEHIDLFQIFKELTVSIGMSEYDRKKYGLFVYQKANKFWILLETILKRDSEKTTYHLPDMVTNLNR